MDTVGTGGAAADGCGGGGGGRGTTGVGVEGVTTGGGGGTGVGVGGGGGGVGETGDVIVTAVLVFAVGLTAGILVFAKAVVVTSASTCPLSKAGKFMAVTALLTIALVACA